MRTFLTFGSYQSAKDADAAVCQFLRARDGNLGSQWSGVFKRTDGLFGIFWDQPVSDALGQSASDTEIVGNSGASNWANYSPPPPA